MSDENADMSRKVKESRDYQEQKATQDKGQRKVVISESRTGRHLGEENWNQDRSCPRRPGTMA